MKISVVALANVILAVSDCLTDNFPDNPKYAKATPLIMHNFEAHYNFRIVLKDQTVHSCHDNPVTFPARQMLTLVGTICIKIYDIFL